MRLDDSIKGAAGFSVLPSDHLVARPRLSVSADAWKKKKREQWNNKWEKNGGKREGESPSQKNFQILPLPEKLFLVSKCQMSKRQKVQCKAGIASITLPVCQRPVY